MTIQSSPADGYFITGSDTDVGKTWIARQIVAQLQQNNSSVKVRKPVESGCKIINGERFPADGHALFEANKQRESLEVITPYRFLAALAPDRAARLEQQQIYLAQLHQACLNQVGDTDTLLVEGAGGFYSPICEDGLNSDLAKLLGLKVIIVTEDRLGGINQALLTIAAVQQERLQVHALILNQNNDSNTDNLDNFSDLGKRTNIPLYQCAYNSSIAGQVV